MQDVVIFHSKQGKSTENFNKSLALKLISNRYICKKSLII